MTRKLTIFLVCDLQIRKVLQNIWKITRYSAINFVWFWRKWRLNIKNKLIWSFFHIYNNPCLNINVKSMEHFSHMIFYYKRPGFALERTVKARESFFLNTAVSLVGQSIKWYSSSSLLSTTKSHCNKPYKINILKNKNVFYLFRRL